jgi:hypothetical protein
MDNNNSIIDNLLIEFKEQREALKVMILDLEKVKEKIDTLFPDSLDKRFSRFFEEKVKTASGIFSTLLEIRKEITRGLKDEIEIRRKLEKETEKENFDIEEFLDIRKLAGKVEHLRDISNSKIDKVESLRN